MFIFNYFLFPFWRIPSPCSFFLSVFCLPVLLSSFSPISKSSYEPSLLSVKSNAVNFNRSWINSHGFHFPTFFFSPASSVCSPSSQLLLPFSTSLELTWTFLSITYLTPFCSSPSLSLSCSFPSIYLTAISLIYHLTSYWALQSTPTTVVWEQIIHIKIRISLLFPPLSFTNDAKKAGVGFCSVALPLPSLPLPSSPGEIKSQRCGLHKIIISL